MTKRQPKGTPIGGQFAQDRKPSGGDLSATEPRQYNYDKNAMRTAMSGLKRVGRDYEYKGHLIERNRGIGKWSCRVNLGDGRFVNEEYDTLKEAKWALDNLKSSDTVGSPTPNREIGTLRLDEHIYQFEKIGPENDVTKYTLTNEDGGGGWRFEIDGLTRRVKAHGVHPVNPSAEWRDKGEADIRTVVRLFEPDAKLLDLDGDTYLIGGDPWPLSKSHLTGINVAQMMLAKGHSEDEVLKNAMSERSDLERKLLERPDLANSIHENLLFCDGMEIAIGIGSAAAKANTVGATEKRFGSAS